jgi:hypothetical protein
VVGKIPEISKEYTVTIFRVECGVLRIRAKFEPHKHSTECGLEKEQRFTVDHSEQYTDRRTDGRTDGRTDRLAR